MTGTRVPSPIVSRVERVLLLRCTSDAADGRQESRWSGSSSLRAAWSRRTRWKNVRCSRRGWGSTERRCSSRARGSTLRPCTAPTPLLTGPCGTRSANARRQIASRLELDDTGLRDGQQYSLRWIYTHMIEEYARHNGHADLLRELVDGAVGW